MLATIPMTPLYTCIKCITMSVHSPLEELPREPSAKLERTPRHRKQHSHREEEPEMTPIISSSSSSSAAGSDNEDEEEDDEELGEDIE